MKIDDFKGNIIKNTIYNKKINSKIIVLADIHGYTSNNKLLMRLVKAIKELKPDIILIAGDIFNNGKAWEGGPKLLRFRDFLSHLSLICPVCITLGNHDLRGMNKNNKELRLRKFYDLKKLNLNRIYPLYNDKVKVNNIEILGYDPRFELMEEEGLKTQIYGLTHGEFIKDYDKKGVKFLNDNSLKIYLGHAPHLIGISESNIGLGDLSSCDFFVTGQPTCILTHDGKKINRLFSPIYGKTNLCQGIVYIDNSAQQKVLDIYNKFYVNESNELNIQKWKLIDEIKGREIALNNSLHPMLISKGLNPTFLKREKFVNINYIEFINKE